VPDYGYCDWLFDLALQLFRSALNFSILLVTAKSSSCPPDRFFRIDLHGRSYQVSHLKPIFRSAFNEKFPTIRRQFSTSANFPEPKFLPIFHLPESTLQ
jgi:hypothetical protein